MTSRGRGLPTGEENAGRGRAQVFGSTFRGEPLVGKVVIETRSYFFF